jgi:hypothetical protein
MYGMVVRPFGWDGPTRESVGRSADLLRKVETAEGKPRSHKAIAAMQRPTADAPLFLWLRALSCSCLQYLYLVYPGPARTRAIGRFLRSCWRVVREVPRAV